MFTKCLLPLETSVLDSTECEIRHGQGRLDKTCPPYTICVYIFICMLFKTPASWKELTTASSFDKLVTKRWRSQIQDWSFYWQLTHNFLKTCDELLNIDKLVNWQLYDKFMTMINNLTSVYRWIWHRHLSFDKFIKQNWTDFDMTNVWRCDK